MKITKAQLDELIKSLIPNAELVDDGDGADLNEVIMAINESRKPILRTVLKDELHKEVKGKLSGSLQRELIRAYGVTEADIEGLSNEEAIKKATAIFLEKNSTQQPKDVEETLNALKSAKEAELLSERQKWEQELNDYKSKLNEATRRYEMRDIKSALRKLAKDNSFDTSIDMDEAIDYIYNKLSTSSDLKYDETAKELKVFKKGSDVPQLNEAGSSLFDLNEAIKSIAKPLNWIKEDTSSVAPSDVMSNLIAQTQQQPIQQQTFQNSREAFNAKIFGNVTS